jgi:1-phosphatidylinositol phosphodiesterase|tara:strand:- start:244 stop:1461 length:1218 start_codon:yes stop_codon:yes gene_type:complete
MSDLKVRNCTVWDVHYWKVSKGNEDDIAEPGKEGIINSSTTGYTLGVKRVNISPDGRTTKLSVSKSGIYYVVWNGKKLDILTEAEALKYPHSDDNKYLSKWFKTNSTWMSYLDGALTLDKFSIPGTHDSGTKKTGKGIAHTQNFDIDTQLEDGIRFLDIRLDGVTEFDSKLVVKHGCILCSLSFGDVLDSCKSFLKKNSEETIIMLVDSCHCEVSIVCSDADIANRFDDYLNKPEYKNLFYLGTEIPKLDAVRGRVVLFRRFKTNGSDNMGLNLSGDAWKDDQTFSLETPQGNVFQIEDQYSEHNTPKKLKAVEANLNKAISNPNDGKMFITYNSISGKLTRTPYQYAWGGPGIAPVMNPSLKTYLHGKSGSQRFGTIMLDFYNNRGSNNGIVEAIIRSNDGLKQ